MATSTTTASRTASNLTKATKSKHASITAVNERADLRSTSYEQSLQFVQAVILVAVSMVADMRKILSPRYFEDRALSNILSDVLTTAADPAICGSQDTSQHTVIGSRRNSSKNKRFRIIDRHISARSEKLYRWLDGIFDGISRRYIDAVQMTVIAQKDKPEHVLESYLFSIQYSINTNGDDDVDVALTTAKQAKPVNIAKSRAGIYNLTKSLEIVLRTCPDLPNARWISFNIFFVDTRPAAYNPYGFRSSEQTSMLVPESEDWKFSVSTVGGSSTGSHNVEVMIAHMIRTSGDIQKGSNAYKVPENLQFAKMLSRRTFSALPKGDAVVHDKNRFVTCVRSKTPATPSSTNSAVSVVAANLSLSQQQARQVQNGIPQTEDSSMEDVVGRTRSVLVPISSNQSGQRPSTGSIRNHLLVMQHSPSINSRISQTQNQKASEIGVDVCWGLVPDKMEELWQKRDSYISQPEFNAAKASIRCECGSAHKEGQIFPCDCCEDWQHEHCYAYDQPLERAFENVRACYTCLLEGTDDQLLLQLQDMTRMRRICWMLRAAESPIPKTSLITKLGYDERETGILLDSLVDAGLLKVNLDKISLDLDVAKINFNKQGLLHPLSRIAHLYEPVSLAGNDDPAMHSGRKHGRDDDQQSITTDTQDLNVVSSGKKRKISPDPITPEHCRFKPIASMETLSPMTASTDH